MGIFEILLLLLLFLLGGIQTSTQPQVEPRLSFSISQAYENSQLVRYAGQYFPLDQWEAIELLPNAYHPTIAFRSSTFTAVVAISSVNINASFNDKWFKSLLLGYNPWLTSVQCERSHLQLFEIKGTSQGGDIYLTRYWITRWRTNRLLTVHLVFPIDHETDLNRYAQLMFPELSTCAN